MKILKKAMSIALVVITVVSVLGIATTQVFANYDDLYRGKLTTKLYWDTSYDSGMYTKYRLPSVVVTKQDTVIVYGEARNENSNVDGGNHDECLMDLYIRRSTDGGVTFGAPIYIARGSEYLAAGLGETLNNSVIFVGNDGILHMLFSCDVAKKGIFYTKSEDDGLTWATPKNISDQFRRYNYGKSNPNNGR